MRTGVGGCETAPRLQTSLSSTERAGERVRSER